MLSIRLLIYKKSVFVATSVSIGWGACWAVLAILLALFCFAVCLSLFSDVWKKVEIELPLFGDALCFLPCMLVRERYRNYLVADWAQEGGNSRSSSPLHPPSSMARYALIVFRLLILLLYFCFLSISSNFKCFIRHPSWLFIVFRYRNGPCAFFLYDISGFKL